ncbi:ABC transporter ATP-binding protein [Brucellaceae bacterium C25G]
MHLSCQNLSVYYSHQQVLDDFKLDLNHGEICTLIGPNGSGKSTALQTIAGLIKPHTGNVSINNKPIHLMHRRLLAQQLAFLPQHPVAPDEIRVRQLVRQARFAHIGLLSPYKKTDEYAIEWALSMTNLSAYHDRFLKELSGGERQRVWIAAALAQEAKILLLDEPTSFLDIGYQVEILDLLYHLSRERNTTILMAIHDINQALAISDRICLLTDGKQIFNDTSEKLAKTELIEKSFSVRGKFISLPEKTTPFFDIDWLA